MFIFYSVILFSYILQNTTDGKPGMELGRMEHVDEDFCTAVTNSFGEKLDM